MYDTRRQWFWKFEILTGYFWNLVPDRQGEHLQQTQKNAKCDEYVLLESKTGLLKDNKMLFVDEKMMIAKVQNTIFGGEYGNNCSNGC